MKETQLEINFQLEIMGMLGWMDCHSKRDIKRDSRIAKKTHSWKIDKSLLGLHLNQPSSTLENTLLLEASLTYIH